MDKLNNYRQLIQQVLTSHSTIEPSYGDIERFTVCDREGDRYQIVSVGWENRNHI